jgi:hypothetical protein
LAWRVAQLGLEILYRITENFHCLPTEGALKRLITKAEARARTGVVPD